MTDHEFANLIKRMSHFLVLEILGAYTDLDASKWDFSSLVNARDLFYGCIALKEIQGMGNWDTRNLESLWDTFGVCRSLETLEGLQYWDLSSAVKIAGTFRQCRTLTDEDIPVLYNWDMSKVTSYGAMFAGCSNLVGGAGTVFQGDDLKYAHVDGGAENPGYMTYKAPATTNP